MSSNSPPRAPFTEVAPPLPTWANALENVSLVPHLSNIDQLMSTKLNPSKDSCLSDVSEAAQQLSSLLRGSTISDNDVQHILHICGPIRIKISKFASAVLKRAYPDDYRRQQQNKPLHQVVLECAVHLSATMFLKRDCSMVKFVLEALDNDLV